MRLKLRGTDSTARGCQYIQKVVVTAAEVHDICAPRALTEFVNDFAQAHDFVHLLRLNLREDCKQEDIADIRRFHV